MFGLCLHNCSIFWMDYFLYQYEEPHLHPFLISLDNLGVNSILSSISIAILILLLVPFTLPTYVFFIIIIIINALSFISVDHVQTGMGSSSGAWATDQWSRSSKKYISFPQQPLTAIYGWDLERLSIINVGILTSFSFMLCKSHLGNHSWCALMYVPAI